MSKIIINGKSDGSLKAYLNGEPLDKLYVNGETAYTRMETGSQPEPPEPKYLCFTAEQAGSTIGMSHYGTNKTTTNPVIYISFNGRNWTLWDYTTITLANTGDKAYMYGDNPNGVCHGDYDYSRFWISGRAGASGDITTLITREGTTSLSGTDGTFSKLFYECNKLTTAPELPATTLAAKCYYHMFYGCTSLTTAPDLPAMTMLHACYFDMFSGCTSLTSAPSTLPATTLAQQCYQHMFQNCTSLTTAPSILPATTLSSRCYKNMFSGCTSLITAPELPATTLAHYCYEKMFSGCTSLTSAPALPATRLTQYCYQYMFQGCTAMTTAPATLPATTLASYCYAFMFQNCTSLTTAPALPATTLASYCYAFMFNGCSSLTAAPSLPATTLAERCYAQMFNGCSSLTAAPSLPATTLAQQCYEAMFLYCTSLVTPPELPATTLAPFCYNCMFYGCTSLTTAPELPATSIDAECCYQSMFSGCTSLEEITVSASQWNTESAAEWVYGVAASGIIHTPQDCDIPYPSVNGAPEGWTVDGGYTEAGNEIATDYVDVYVDPQGYSGDITFNGAFSDNTNGQYGSIMQPIQYIFELYDSNGNMVLSNANYIDSSRIYNGQFSINESGQMSFSDETWPPVTLTGTWHIMFDVEWENNFQTIEKNDTWECEAW